jgi:MPBQ/MSBQ methyltransferase
MTSNQSLEAEVSDAARGALNQLYQDRMYDPLIHEYYGDSGFLNFGYREDGRTCSAAEASIQLMDKLLDLIPQKSGKILDVACGIGATTSYLLKYFNPEDVTGIDISDKQLDTCRQKIPKSTFKKMNAVDLQFEDETFDHIICVEAAFHFYTREDFLREARRVLKPGGNLDLCDVLISDEFKQNRPHFCPQNMVADPDEYRKEYQRAEFSDIQIVDVTSQCWESIYWDVITFVHQKLLEGTITKEAIEPLLSRVYKLAADLKYYVLVAATK